MKELFNSVLKRINEEVSRIREDKQMMNRIYIITFGTALLILAVAVKGPEEKGRIMTDDKGLAVGIERNSVDTSESYDFEVIIREGQETIVREVNLTLRAAGNGQKKDALLGEQSREDELDMALSSVLNELEQSGSRKIRLPASLRDGTKIDWRNLNKKDYSALFLIPLIYTGLLVFVLRSGRGSEKEAANMKKISIMRSLPRFCNQLFLMMNAGMILSDAFGTISASYGAASAGDDKPGGYFEREIAGLYKKNPERRTSTAAMINEFAVRNDVKEMIRIATILTENEKRGSDVIESLSRESRYLWDERKTVARESGKMIDTKMAYPLGILLILLIVITMAPAMLSM